MKIKLGNIKLRYRFVSELNGYWKVW